jgi:hypothetical protein
LLELDPSVRAIPVGQHDFALVDACDYDDLSRFNWRLTDKGYAYRDCEPWEQPTLGWRELMHRRIMGYVKGDGKQVDHKHGSRLDNRRSQLRPATYEENARNCRLHRNSASRLKGVSFHKDGGPLRKWKAQIQHNGKAKHLGMFETAELAHEFYCLAADLLFGEFARYA